MARAPLLTAEQAQEMRDLEAAGWTRTAIARHFNVSPTTVTNYLREDVVPVARRPATARRAIDEFIAELPELEGERRALAAIARTLADRIDGAPAAGSAAVAARTLADLVTQLGADVRREQGEARAREALQAIGLKVA
jgi:predicted transcriptional regulator